MNNYDDSSIKTMTGLDIVRNRPTQYLPDLQHPGLSHMVIELQDNALDEASSMGTHGRVDILIFQDKKNKTFQAVVKDNGRGIPLKALHASFTIPNTSGKYDKGAYKYPSGLFGVGGKVVAGLSNKFRIVSFKDKNSASTLVTKGTHGTGSIFQKSKYKTNGVYVMFQPDETIFTGVESYSESGWTDILERIKKYVFFHDTHVNFYLLDGELPYNIWQNNNDTVRAIIDEAVNNNLPMFTSRGFNKEAWLKNYLSVSGEFDWQYSLSRVADTDDLVEKGEGSSLIFDIKLYHTMSGNFGRLGLLNTVPIDNVKSDHIGTIVKTLTTHISNRITAKEIKDFFVESYTLPICMAVNTKYEGAQFSGTTKHSFISSAFREEYFSYLDSIMKSPESKIAIDNLYVLLEEDIKNSYIQSVTGGSKVKFQGRLYQELNFPKKFLDCSTKDRTKAELFIVEGESAGGGISGERDDVHQGIYSIRGKPFNAIKNAGGDINNAFYAIQADAIYQDIIKIIGLNPSKPNINELYFNKIILLTDADSHGRHIAAIVTANLYILCPDLILSGKLCMAAPPYYGIQYVNKSLKKKQYVLNHDALITWFTKNVYSASLDINISYEHLNSDGTELVSTTTNLTDDNYESFIAIVLATGDKLFNLSKELTLDPTIVEMLTYVSGYLTPETMNISEIRKILDLDTINYDKHGNLLMLSIGRNDYVIPLHEFRDKLYSELLPILSTINWRKMQIYITSKNHSHYQNEQVSIGQLYRILKKFEDLFHIKQFKGLGGMPPEDCYITCMDPSRRTIHVITSVSDIDVVFDLLGNDSSARKNLLSKQITFEDS